MAAFDTLKRDYANQWGNGRQSLPGMGRQTSLGRAGMGRTPEERRANAPQESEQMAQEAEDLRLENVDIMKAELAKREEAKNRPLGTPDMDWKPGIPGHLLSKEDNPWQTFYDNEYKRGVLGSMAKGGMGSPGGAAIMGSGDVTGTAADAEHAETARQSAAAMKQMQQQATPAAGGGGTGKTSGTVTVTPGGNVARGPAMDDFDRARLREAEAKAKAAEEDVPSKKAERERIDEDFDYGTGRQERRRAEKSKDITSAGTAQVGVQKAGQIAGYEAQLSDAGERLARRAHENALEVARTRYTDTANAAGYWKNLIAKTQAGARVDEAQIRADVAMANQLIRTVGDLETSQSFDPATMEQYRKDAEEAKQWLATLDPRFTSGAIRSLPGAKPTYEQK